MGKIIPFIMENKKCAKPPTRLLLKGYFDVPPRNRCMTVAVVAAVMTQLMPPGRSTWVCLEVGIDPDHVPFTTEQDGKPRNCVFTLW